MSCQERIFIHIGSPKAASTTLQINLFMRHPEINYLGPNLRINSEELNHFIATNNLSLKHIRERSRFWQKLIMLNQVMYEHENIGTILKEDYVVAFVDRQKPNVISHEGLSNSSSGDNGLKAIRLHELFPAAKILLIIRNQSSLLRSLYDMHPRAPISGVNFGKTLSIEQWLEVNFKNPHRGFLMGMMYAETISFYKKLFGEEAIKVLMFEDLKFQIDKFSSELSDFLEVDSGITEKLLMANPVNTFQEHQLHNLREKILPSIQFSKLMPKDMHYYLVRQLTRALPHRKTSIPVEYQEKIRQLYKETNQRLITDFGIDVAQYGYPL